MAEDHFWVNAFNPIFYCDAIVPLPIEMANGFVIKPNEEFVEPDGVSFGGKIEWKEKNEIMIIFNEKKNDCKSDSN